MLSKREDFQRVLNGRQVDFFVLQNSEMSVGLTNYGCRLVNIIVKGKDGKPVDVEIGYKTLDGYLSTDNCFGAIIGRYANRIYKGDLKIDGITYTLPINNGINCLHGGVGFDKKVFQVVAQSENSIQLALTDEDGSNGFPGTVEAKVTYTLTGKTLEMKFEATTDKKTVINMANHSYLNMNGSGNIDGHVLQIQSDEYLPLTPEFVPTGEFVKVAEDKIFDFNEEKKIGQDIHKEHEQLKLASGYDHCYVLKKQKCGECGFAAKLVGDVSGIVLKVYTTQPGVQLYTDNFMPENFEIRTAVCLETQNYPDSPHHEEFPSVVLAPGAKYEHKCIYSFE
ncbi:aldose 1-epimerase, putative [Entamoeba invadens IP1]|uniref:Aldose 1-epimerase n=2 Tax=Entamoeba invadens TaxID=33085 RepID=A0A0A1UFS7_ENTIV|nr:aldose 1-epimerase, putative [Entamoeba invadens IP1]BAN40216.1 aldose 1-epimerase, putative [Entamoeba invadens]ELP92935.1 aldose 1-epimerase, putative [Entamoeba invadens IP1]BAN40781.1 aldose 1-epimerase, putative [Entamoeba invadens]BAN41062.1 aldose 1-epimerase, putative [Entamoeba invadens]BAN41233.1 aldose 1-epimerase, putative [Entamoeba invadens]|eukprot:XP_004259706.1 aldose 1-epimerase, putative [Entamoeba invadens IP1]